MIRVRVRAPLRADLAGGTLDLWPLYLFHPGSRTVNVAIGYHAESEVAATDSKSIEVFLTDQNYRRRYDTLAEVSEDPKVVLLARVLEHFGLTGVSITTRTDAPRGSGLGGSSALTVTLVRALSEVAGNPVEGEDLIALVRDLESRLLGMPAGVQDYYPPVYGGLASLHLGPGRIVRQPIPLPIDELAECFVLHYSEVSHFSGTNNWEIYKRHIDGDVAVREGLGRIAATSRRMEEALLARDLQAAGAALAEEWSNRKALIAGVSTPEIDAAIEAAAKAGAWGGKVCGAGGGGCIVFLTPARKRSAVIKALGNVAGSVVDAVPVPYGLVVDQLATDQAVFSFAGRRFGGGRGAGESLEQLYLVADSAGNYQPHVVASAVVTFDEPRIGVHWQVERARMAPVDLPGGMVVWDKGADVDFSRLSLSAVPEATRAVPSVSEQTLQSSALGGQEVFRQQLAERERLTIFQNPAFGLYSETGETRESFLERCLAEAKRQLAEKSEGLESTARRRLDQMKQRAEQEQREIEDNESEAGKQVPTGVSIPWGQTLANITSGKPVSAGVPDSVREEDYMKKISQLQKMWNRERKLLKDELQAKARAIEQIEIAPSARNIEITKYLIVWAPG